MMNRLDILTRSDGKFDFRIIAVENGQILAASHQGYERIHECIDTGRRVLNAAGITPTDPVLTFNGEVQS